MNDPAEIRAEGRRLYRSAKSGSDTTPADWQYLDDWMIDHADVLLADPAPVGLTEDERELVEDARAERSAYWIRLQHPKLLAIIDRLSAAPVDDRERVPEGWRVEWHEIKPGHENCVLCIRWSKVPTLVPVSPSVDPEEG